MLYRLTDYIYDGVRDSDFLFVSDRTQIRNKKKTMKIEEILTKNKLRWSQGKFLASKPKVCGFKPA